MRAINHSLTGAFIGLVVGQPLLAVPLAVISHYACDVLPHYGANSKGNKEIKSTAFRNGLYIDAGLCFLLIVILAIVQPTHWLLAAVCAFAAASPDFFWVSKYLYIRAGKKYKPGLYSRIAEGIQWFERPIGMAVEIAWFGAALVLLMPFMIAR